LNLLSRPPLPYSLAAVTSRPWECIANMQDAFLSAGQD
jgi:hypothetical protein